MEIREFATTILYGNNLTADKLLQPETLTDNNPGQAIISPVYPCRPKGLEFSQGHANKKIEFPNLNQLECDYQRGIVLHFFANHELLAMELMALTLLRFPNAPSAFRLGVAKTILEEQKHMRMYMDRMCELGVDFGEIPVNDFFWKCLSDMSSPMDYVTKLSLTFEQANLDYSFFYMNLMEKIGDNKTADILKVVLDEEIGHVKHGVVWFDRWREQGSSQWECYLNSLELPLTPARAKGSCYLRKARESAGLSKDFIDQLFVFSASKGRPPDIYYFNPCAENEIARGKVGYSPVESVRKMQSDCASLCGFLASQDDIVLVPKKPSIGFLKNLKNCGFDLPEWHEYGKEKINVSLFPQNQFGSLCPWGLSPDSLDFLKIFIPKIKINPYSNSSADNLNALLKNLYSKSFAVEITSRIQEKFSEYKDILPTPSSLPTVYKGAIIQEVSDIIRFYFPISNWVVLKSPYGTAGQNMRRVCSEKLNENEINWINKVLLEHKELIIEPWFDKVSDFSAQLKYNKEKSIYLGMTSFLTDKRGQYYASIVSKKVGRIETGVLKFLYTKHGAKNIAFTDIFKEIALFVGEQLGELGYRGSFGIDVFVYRDAASPYGFRVKFISEINPRFTMGRVALEISKRVLPGTPAIWIHLRLKDVLTKFSLVKNFVDKVTEIFPLALVNNAKPQIKNGVLFTNDPYNAQNTLTVLVVGESIIDKFMELVQMEDSKSSCQIF